ncbi:unnamed protein product [Linum tenue]|uniref:Protein DETOXIFICATION n=1 Tax=Linum tenue TaxID=586396 RepID=A0AAV0GZ01_9ROSI|nr:unnamed protein product [Linum tenue]
MQIQTLLHYSSSTPFHPLNPKVSIFTKSPCRVYSHRILQLRHPPLLSSTSRSLRSRHRLLTCCISPDQELVHDVVGEVASEVVSVVQSSEEEREAVSGKGAGLESQSLWEQMKEIAIFTGPAAGLWLCTPLMSLIDTAVIGQGSSVELAALGPGTVMCDNLSYLFMFLAIATSNMVATSLAKEDKEEVQYQLSVLLFIGLTCGVMMFLFTKFFGSYVLAAFAGSNNSHVVPIANTYVQVRGLAWPAILIGWVAQSASLGMKDSLGPLKALLAATAVNVIGDIVLCSFLGYGIAGAAWATMASQIVAAYMMMDSLKKKGYNPYSISVPSIDDLVKIFGLAGPVFVMMMSKVVFYSLLVYFTTSMSTLTLAAHQVAIQAFLMGTVWGEPLCQTAQSFMPELLFGMNQNFSRARMLLKSLMITGTILGVSLGVLGTCVLLFFPNIFTPDLEVIRTMHKVLIPYFLGLSITPCILSLEGTLLAGRDQRYLGLTMSGCCTVGTLGLMFVTSRGYGLLGIWFTIVGFQWVWLSNNKDIRTT